MIISFFGHSRFSQSEGDLEKVLDLIEKHANGEHVDFYLGCYGRFDRFAYECASQYKKEHSDSKLVFVTPYLANNQRCESFSKGCDETLFPEIEKVPLRLAIIERNKWVITKSDFIIFYYVVGGGTEIVYDFAKRKKKNFINVHPLAHYTD